MAKSPRALTALINSFTWGIVYAGQEPALPLHLQDVWGLDSPKVGLVFLAAIIPTLFSSPLAGWWADRKGAEWVTLICLGCSIPWWCLIIIDYNLAFFIVAFAFENFFTAAIVAPVTSELAIVARGVPGLGYAHVYGAFNMAYGVGSSIGPLIGGQMYEHLKRGWMALNLLFVGMLTISMTLSFIYTGDRPIFTRLVHRIKGQSIILPDGSDESTERRDPDSVNPIKPEIPPTGKLQIVENSHLDTRNV